MSTTPLTAHDKTHLSSVARTMDWASIAYIMNILDWRYYHIHDRSPTAGELRDGSMQYLGECIREARMNGYNCVNMQAGGFSYHAILHAETGIVKGLYCDFVLDCYSSFGIDEKPEPS